MENSEIKAICNAINRRIKQMNSNEEQLVREHFNDNILDEKILIDCIEINTIAEILDVNENCIFNLLQNFKQ
jgi:hypothetical protein